MKTHGVSTHFNPFQMSEDDPTFDWPVVQQLLSRRRGAETAFHRLLRVFESELPTLRAELDRTIAEESLADIRNCAHKLKGSASVLGAARVKEVAARFVTLADRGILPPREGLTNLDDEVRAFCTKARALRAEI